MSDTIDTDRPPRRMRLLSAVEKEPDWSTMTAEDLVAFRTARNRKVESRLARVITGRPDRGAAIEWQEVSLPGRRLKVRVHRPTGHGHQADLPLVLHVHGGGFAGTAVQSDWVNSHLAARLPAVIISVEHRLLSPELPLTAAVDDGWDVLTHVAQHATRWGVDPARVAVFGESCGALVVALAAIRARTSGLPLRAQVLVNPCVDVTPKAFDHASMSQYADSPTLTRPHLQLFCRLAVPAGTDPRPLSPLHASDLSGLTPALVLVPTVDPVADHGRRYAERLRAAGTPARLTEHRGATHGFLATPGLVPQAKSARREIAEFLSGRLAGTQAQGPR